MVAARTCSCDSASLARLKARAAWPGGGRAGRQCCWRGSAQRSSMVMRRPGGAGRLLQHRAGVVVQRAEQLGEGRIDRTGVGRPPRVLLAEEGRIRPAECGGEDIDASHRYGPLSAWPPCIRPRARGRNPAWTRAGLPAPHAAGLSHTRPPRAWPGGRASWRMLVGGSAAGGGQYAAKMRARAAFSSKAPWGPPARSRRRPNNPLTPRVCWRPRGPHPVSAPCRAGRMTWVRPRRRSRAALPRYGLRDP